MFGPLDSIERKLLIIGGSIVAIGLVLACCLAALVVFFAPVPDAQPISGIESPDVEDTSVATIPASATPAPATETPIPATVKPTATQTPSPKPTATHTPIPEPTSTPDSISEATASQTLLPEPTSTPQPTATDTPRPEPTSTETAISESTATSTPSPEATSTFTPTPQPTATDTPRPEPTSTETAISKSTATSTPSPEATSTFTPTPQPTATDTSRPEPTSTEIATSGSTATSTPSPEATSTPVPAATSTEAIDTIAASVNRGPVTESTEPNSGILLIVIEFLISISVIITAVRAYLRINKKWKWRHDKSVAESISVVAMLMTGFTESVFFIKFALIDGSFAPAINLVFELLISITFFLIGIGMWVKGNQRTGFFKLVLQALNLERKESTDLIKSFLRPAGAEQVLIILEKVAAIDNEVAPEEIELISEFARQWKLEPPDLQVGSAEGTTNLLDLRQSVLNYLHIQPPVDQAAQLVDVLELLIKADAEITETEELIFAELTGLINDYVSDAEQVKTMFEVLLVPQDENQIDAIKTLVPNATFDAYRGGQAFSVGRFYSEQYAEAICQRYISLGSFSTWVEQ